ncbi:tyrosine-type recombinase/integrase [Streptococcus equi subsp. zooepidemicus]|uniref:Gp32 n=1 Tax=Streptococcus equi subsp. zooepidemicus TaxID=40041 RepID=A0AAJ1PIU9_STRSZ|nr:tyrosine-type recombinase/integrase [Streptococcus equi]MCD3372270.1 tyrosine-type recombinase/integrase [Streptococcus equi subsp. zooepidemicus]MCD3386896.1 tyrosine-type recombinase/integrase [Streptococcus equi subsp. zooepidemicus]MCD3390876.1 tyrosine-type recombinase/integrase [Streptococcus equi subsp. zooepidemicus]MCD3417792.1 tyrosine-type recombinase/integrase [Streptococcus equi subsp. zooepidemicus]MCD3422903.1 tyrosine-type recombinase/integrase [Streptococcus equi subsp. zoo
MKSVEPIRDTDDIERMKDYLKEKNERDFVLVVVGLYSGMRISDILVLKVRDVLLDRIRTTEKKTGKTKVFAINPVMRKVLDQYIKNKKLKEYDYLFPSRKRDKDNGSKIVPIGRVAAYQIIKGAANHVGLKNIGTHSLRKTFGYHHYKKYGNVAILMEIFNHSSPDITLVYIGYKQDEIDKYMVDFSY